jgi:hypothetical protein
MFAYFTGTLFLIAFGTIGFQFLLKLRSLRSAESGSAPFLTADRYRPMLRLLSNDDLAFVASNHKLRKTLRAKRRDLFRGYLRCLTRDYGILLAGVRKAMVQSGVDRPDLARALAKNRMLFAMAICKIEIRLALHATGMANVEVSGLVDAMEALRGQVSVFSAASFAAAPQTA